MALSYETQNRGVKVLVNGLHMKTIPKKYLESFKINNNYIDFNKKKRLSKDEEKVLERNRLFLEYLFKIRKTDRHLYQLIKDSLPTAARKVITRDKERMELQLDNKMKINCPSVRLFKLFPHTSDAYLNY